MGATCERCHSPTGAGRFDRPKRYRCGDCFRLVCWYCCAPLTRLSRCFDCQSNREQGEDPRSQESHHRRVAG